MMRHLVLGTPGETIIDTANATNAAMARYMARQVAGKTAKIAGACRIVCSKIGHPKVVL